MLPDLLQPQDLADVGIFGGSGFYSLFEGEVQHVSVQTPFGAPSDAFAVGRVGEARVAFLPRHGARHRIPPHEINYRANIWAMAQLGAKRVIAPSAVGSLKPEIRPGDFVICDQFVDRTYGRAQTFFDGPRVVHVSTADPYCPELRALAVRGARDLGIAVHDSGTVVVIQGPRFSTRAESRWFSAQGWDVVNMTQFPEASLARELELCYVNVSLTTDFDAGLEGQPDVHPVSVEDVIRVMSANTERVRRLIDWLVPRLPPERACPCASALQYAVVS